MLLAHLDIVRRTGKVIPDASARHVAERVCGAGRGSKIAASSESRPPAAWVTRRSGKSSARATPSHPRRNTSHGHPHRLQYLLSLVNPRKMLLLRSNSVPVSNLCVMYAPKHFAFHEIWAWKGLGKAELRVWTLLRRQSNQRSSELANSAGVSPRQIQAQLSRLSSHGLARKLKRGQWEGLLPTADDLDKLGASIGVAGVRRHLHEAHERERREADLRLAVVQYRATKGTRRFSNGKPRGLTRGLGMGTRDPAHTAGQEVEGGLQSPHGG